MRASNRARALALRTAIDALPRLPTGVFLAVNASPPTILAPALTVELKDIEIKRLVLKVTEQRPIDSYRHFADALHPLRQRGLRLAIDDVGAGFASLNHILRLAPDLIKFDRSLTREIDTDHRARALAVAVTGFALETGTAVLAEGIETDRQLAVVKALGFSLGQGYLLGRPAPLPSPPPD
jgi:EAL domain-containing protein (putative c-di-GMP-specific phosphodiesterase class I)